MVKLLAIDLDGTLLSCDHTVSVANRRAIEAAQAAGIEVVIASARVWHSARRFALQHLPAMDYAVLHDGQMIVRPETGDWLDTTTIDATTVRRIVRNMTDLPVSIELCRPADPPKYDYVVALDQGPTQAMLKSWRPPPQPPIHIAPAPTDQDLTASFSLRFIAEDWSTLDRVEERLEPEAQNVRFYRFTEPDDGFVITQAMPPHTGKWDGIAWVADRLGIASEEIAVIGDEVNDIEALEKAGLGIAVGNAIDQAKAAANIRLNQTNDQDAVAVAINDLLKKGQ